MQKRLKSYLSVDWCAGVIFSHALPRDNPDSAPPRVECDLLPYMVIP